MIRRLITALALSCLLPLAHAAEKQATTLQACELRSEPYSDANISAQLEARQQVSVLKRKGGWYQVNTAEGKGWLRMSQLRFGDAETTRQSNTGNGLAQAFSFLTSGRSGSSGVTVATGIRGLDAADMTNARPNHRAVKRLEKLRVSAANARRYAGAVKLRTQPLGYFDTPEQ